MDGAWECLGRDALLVRELPASVDREESPSRRVGQKPAARPRGLRLSSLRQTPLPAGEAQGLCATAWLCCGCARAAPRGAGASHLEGLHEGPQQDPDGVTLAQQLDEAGGSEQLQEAEVEATGVHQLAERKRGVSDIGVTRDS